MVLKLTISLLLLSLGFSSAKAYPAAENVSHDPSENILFSSFGTESSRSLVSIQPYLTNEDFKTTQNFYFKMRKYFLAAKNAGSFRENTVVILPELIGLYLYFANERDSVYSQNSLTGAGTQIVLSLMSRPGTAALLLRQPPFSLPGQPFNILGLINRKLLNYKSEFVARDYQQTFSNLAKEFGVTIAAGSVPLPGPFVNSSGKIDVNKNLAMKNVGFLFHKDGQVDKKTVFKVHPISSESALFIEGGRAKDLPVYDLPIGRVAFIICADSWYPDIYESLKDKKVDVILAGSNLGPKSIGLAPWKGYNSYVGTAATPDDVDPTDVGWISEWEAWQKYALLGRYEVTGAQYVLSSFIKGELWGEDFFGGPFVGLPGVKKAIDGDVNQPAVVTLFMNEQGQ